MRDLDNNRAVIELDRYVLKLVREMWNGAPSPSPPPLPFCASIYIHLRLVQLAELKRDLRRSVQGSRVEKPCAFESQISAV